MLRGLLICPDPEVAERFEAAVGEASRVAIVRELSRYPSALELMRLIRAHAPHVLFISAERLPSLLEIVAAVEQQAPGVQMVAISRTTDPALLLDVMRAGIREFLSLPFPPGQLAQTVGRLEETAVRKPPAVESTDLLYSFLPSKAGVGTSTIALNAALGVSRIPGKTGLLLDLDLNCGIIGFMLKLNAAHSIVEAAENSTNLDETLWPQLVSKAGGLDVLHAGPLNTGRRIEPVQIRYILEFARRHYDVIAVDLSGNMEQYSIEIMHESRQIFLVCTPEITSLHLAREKYHFLSSLDLSDRVSVLLNRSHRKSLISPAQIEDLMGVKVYQSLPNDYQGVHRAVHAGKAVEPGSELGKCFTQLAKHMVEGKQEQIETRKSFLEYFSVRPANAGDAPTSERR